MLIIGIRALLDNDEPILLSQLTDARKHFPGAKIVLAVCGDDPSEKIKGLCDKVLYYSQKPSGLTEPLRIIIDHAKEHNANELIITDGDDQFYFSEIRRLYELGKSSGYDAVIPKRVRKSLFFQDGNYDRVLVEDCENILFRKAYPNGIKDPQPGVEIMLNRDTISCLSMENVPCWIGDIVITYLLLYNRRTITEPEIKTREQSKTHMNVEREFEKISQMQNYFGINIDEAIPEGNLLEIYEIFGKNFKSDKN
ncbi:hypothetical protein CUJ83_07770 [Methanocella sp. CWC-04]|uniref:Glycosyl transferase family 2 n=1 Tax=Methanooceanicella nereidis TaxID=2052831 RepID=A0AAP2RCS3_9EURY|nr:hypothetical protein [Methanocella sp. CWC-04]MCD1294894.1 hypothetical protein [Methanocella sp. CWC-04]